MPCVSRVVVAELLRVYLKHDHKSLDILLEAAYGRLYMWSITSNHTHFDGWLCVYHHSDGK